MTQLSILKEKEIFLIFDFKSINNINDEEIDDIVSSHVSERQHLEFKITINIKDDADKIEFLHDIISFANSGGGYIIVGIRDDGNGKAQKYEPDLVGNTEKIKQVIMSLAHEYISERIEGLEVVTRQIKENPIIIIRIPDSDRLPHMVIYNNRTDFYSRYNDGKKEMTYGEIREAFRKDALALQLTRIENTMSEIFNEQRKEKQEKVVLEAVEKGTIPELATLPSANIIVNIKNKQFMAEIGQNPYFRISITPSNPDGEIIDIDSLEIIQLLQYPPGSRRNGWNMENSYDRIVKLGMSWIHGEKSSEYLELHTNGHMEFWTPLTRLFCWRQSEEEFRVRPRLYPYAVVEYPTTFLRLYRAVIDKIIYKDDFIMSLQYHNLKGYILLPYGPGSVGYMFPKSDLKPFDQENLDILNIPLINNFIPDKESYKMLTIFYSKFGYDSEVVPFYNREKQIFIFPE
jgi:hypothetical protein